MEVTLLHSGDVDLVLYYLLCSRFLLKIYCPRSVEAERRNLYTGKKYYQERLKCLEYWYFYLMKIYCVEVLILFFCSVTIFMEFALMNSGFIDCIMLYWDCLLTLCSWIWNLSNLSHRCNADGVIAAKLCKATLPNPRKKLIFLY